MYKGTRDDYLRVRVPQRLCELVDLPSGRWVEIKLPGTSLKPDSWYSWMVQPDQVFWDRSDPNNYNIIDRLNDAAKIRINMKRIENGRRVIVAGTESVMTPAQLINVYRNT